MSFILFPFLMLHFACDEPATPPPPLQGMNFTYRLNEPDQKLEMDKELEEISALSLGFTPDQLLTLQDEAGKVFFLNRENGTIEKEVRFGKDGDYEGVELVGEYIFVVKSSGTVYRSHMENEDEDQVDSFNGFLKSSNDVEGLTFDQANNRLLLACKGRAGKGDEFKLKRAVFAFDLDDLSFDPDPVYLISLEDVQHYLQTSTAERNLQKLINFFSLDGSDMVFSPSGIAIHPKTGNHYITSSVGKLLMVLNPEGKILHLEKLDPKVHPQPEGICFTSDGTLYISNEGRGGRGSILKFLPTQ